MKNTFFRFQKESQAAQTESSVFKNMKSAETLSDIQYNKVIGGNSNIVIVDLDAF